MARAPAPREIPGEFFVLAYDRDDRTYVLIVDDGSHSSYNLGNIEPAMRYFRVAGLSELGNRAIDLAREFGAAQAIPGEERVFRVTPKPQRGEPLIKFKDETENDSVFYLPDL